MLPERVRDERPDGADSIGVIEIELMKLVRHLETFARRSDLYASVDRAGYLALRTLDDFGPKSVNALAEALHLDASTVTRQVGTLEGAGFITRLANLGDRRSSSIVPTPAGLEIMRTVERDRRRRLETLVGEWREEERRSLGSTMSKLNAALVDEVASDRRP